MINKYSSVFLMLMVLFFSGCSSNPSLPSNSMTSYVQNFLGDEFPNPPISVNNSIVKYEFTLWTTKEKLYFDKSKVCIEKHAVMVGDWCAYNGTTPLYYVESHQIRHPEGGFAYRNVLYENLGDVASPDWKNIYTSLGFITKEKMDLKKKKESDAYKAASAEAENSYKKEKQRLINSVVQVMRSDVGTVICKSENDNYLGLYKGYVEGHSKSKVRVRLFSHTAAIGKFNDTDQQPIIWSAPYGWYVCD